MANENFRVHPIAMPAYRLFCEHFYPLLNLQSLSLKNALVIPVIADADRYYFFDCFEVVALADYDGQITVQILGADNNFLTDADIEGRAWQYLLELLLSINPINPTLCKAFVTHAPKDVRLTGIEGKLTVAKILELKQLERHHYDYQLKKSMAPICHPLPSFSELIYEACHAH